MIDLPFLRPYIYDNSIYTGFFKNYELFCYYSGVDKTECLKKLKKTLAFNLNEDYRFHKKIKKARKMINALAISQVFLFAILIYILLR